MLTFFRRIRKGLINANAVSKYIVYAIGEIVLVVVGILIALQVNNMNQIRLENDRFEFGVKEIHSELQSSQFYQSGLADKLDYQLLRIDSLLLYPNEIPLYRIPPILLIIDQYGLDLGREYTDKIKFLQISPSNKNKSNLSSRLQFYLLNINQVQFPLGSVGLDNVMSMYLRSYNIPIKPFNHGPTYENFVTEYSNEFYSPSYDERIKSLIYDESFRADLKTVKQIKIEEKSKAALRGLSGERFLQSIQEEIGKTDYSLQYMEVVGSGTKHLNWSKGIPMDRISSDGTKWETDLQLYAGEIKFRSDIRWILDWGRGEDNKDLLVFKGGDIKVSDGYYKIRLDIIEGTYDIIPIPKDR
jgi:hypothetical protein